ncbi:MAG: hypothetical protein WCS74_05285 [Dehalococcoidales bacterium]|jgi:hypothetical protein|nr:hypothetical protein [Dehalococcoidales bacterium]MDD3264405.1 hypothetical protein [Dehalococcoidales bacterium]MDD5498260.1 hypothetical protein [Dehalococcoidales bacterium]MDX9804160.1 hypothetical protein [Dehalococcoidales bacterium]
MSNKWFMILVLATVLGVGIFISFTSSQLYMYEPGFSGSYTYNLLLNAGLGLMLGGAGLGLIAGAIVGLISRNNPKPAGKLGAGALFDDWGVSFCALAGLVLMVTGIMLGGVWSPRLVSSLGVYAVTSNMHIVGIVIFLFGSLFIIARMFVSGDYSLVKTLWNGLSFKKRSNYLPSYRWGVWALLIGFAALGIKGFFLVVAHIFHWPSIVTVIASDIHGILALIATLMAIAAIVLMIMESNESKAPVRQSRVAT